MKHTRIWSSLAAFLVFGLQFSGTAQEQYPGFAYLPEHGHRPLERKGWSLPHAPDSLQAVILTHSHGDHRGGGDAVYGCFPNLYPIRGGAYRDVEQWARFIRRLAEFKPEAIMFGHTSAILGEASIQSVLNNTAEAIEYVYSETIKGMNEGKTPDDLAVSVQLGSRGIKPAS